MHHCHSFHLQGAVIALSLSVLAGTATAQIPTSITTLGSPITQNFDGLASTGTSSILPPGWGFVEVGTGSNTTYSAGTGSSATADTYSFGASASTERAFGALLSNSLNTTIGAAFQNDTGTIISSLTISYTGEEWRLGNAGRVDRLDFQYSTDATSLTTGTWTDVDGLDFSSPSTTGTTGALDGNAAANRTARLASIGGLSIAAGATFRIRWTDFNATGADDGLGVDDFSLTPTGQPVAVSAVQWTALKALFR